MRKQRKTRVPVTREIYNDVKRLVKDLGWSQTDVAFYNDIAQSTASHIINSKNYKQYKIDCKGKPIKLTYKEKLVNMGWGKKDLSNNQMIVDEIKKLLKKIV